mmetsp:Transcript_31913/g.80947  ORF Transcript_31913/g.80947 Transcript_31913/m.80947 type:complete len:209 (-) Transcript_31913:479-1105(-)
MLAHVEPNLQQGSCRRGGSEARGAGRCRCHHHRVRLGEHHVHPRGSRCCQPRGRQVWWSRRRCAQWWHHEPARCENHGRFRRDDADGPLGPLLAHQAADALAGGRGVLARGVPHRGGVVPGPRLEPHPRGRRAPESHLLPEVARGEPRRERECGVARALPPGPACQARLLHGSALKVEVGPELLQLQVRGIGPRLLRHTSGPSEVPQA